MFIVCDALGNQCLEECRNVCEREVTILRIRDNELNEAYETVDILLVGNTVSKEREILLPTSLRHSNCVGHDRAYALLIARCIANKLGEDVLIDELLYDTLTGLHLLLLLLVVAASVRLLRVVAAAAHGLFRIRHDERLQELYRGVHRLVVGNILQSQVHEVDLAL